ncbi:MAG: calcium-binding protein, partial [Limnoraphis robusta]
SSSRSSVESNIIEVVGVEIAFGTVDDNRIVGDSEANIILGLDGNDEIFAEDGDDLLQGNVGDDTVVGGAGNDTIFGGQGKDLIFGSQGDDWLSGDLGTDTLSGGEGADTFVLIPDFSNPPDIVTDFNAMDGDKIQLTEGLLLENLAFEVIDTNADGEVDSTLVIVNSLEVNSPLAILSGTVNSGETTLTLEDFISGSNELAIIQTNINSELSLVGSPDDDQIFGTAEDDQIFGLDGNDYLSGESGDDEIYGNFGNDTLDGGEGNDIMRGGQGDDSLIGGIGEDWLSGDIGSDTLVGGEGADTLGLRLDNVESFDVIVDFNAIAGDKISLSSTISLTDIVLNPVDSNADGIIDATAIQQNLNPNVATLGLVLGTVDPLGQTTLTLSDFLIPLSDII